MLFIHGKRSQEEKFRLLGAKIDLEKDGEDGSGSVPCLALQAGRSSQRSQFQVGSQVQRPQHSFKYDPE